MNSRRARFLVAVGVAVLFGIGGFVLGRQLESPEDARAEVAAPSPSLIAVPVESVALSNDVVVRGDAEFEGAVDIELDADLGDGASRVVTGGVLDVDSEVDEGDVIIEVSGRPVFVLQGSLPAFREFKPGLEGDDVLQLEESLARLGFLSVEPDRLYGAATEQAIAAMYEAIGYEARAENEGEESALDGARDAVENAREQLANAIDNLADLIEPPSAVERLNDAEAREARLEAIEGADEGVADARENLTEVLASLPSESLLSAIDGLTAAEQTGDADTIAAANRSVSAAQQADEDSAQRARDQVESARDQLDEAREALADHDALTAAQEADKDTSRAEDDVVDAEEALAQREADLAELEEEVGVRLPAAEVIFLPDLPRTVTSVDVERGDFVSGSVMRISGTEVRITTGVSEANRPLLEVGQQVTIDSEQLGIEVDGEIMELADRTGTNGASETRYYMMVVPIGEYAVADLVGLNFRIQIPLERSEGEVLAVPLAALSAGADGSSRVEVLVGDDTTKLVAVEVGLQDKNRSLVEVTAIDGSLENGDLVVIGIEQAAEAAVDDEAEDGS